MGGCASDGCACNLGGETLQSAAMVSSTTLTNIMMDAPALESIGAGEMMFVRHACGAVQEMLPSSFDDVVSAMSMARAAAKLNMLESTTYKNLAGGFMDEHRLFGARLMFFIHICQTLGKM
eukprot:76090-Pyramimonas_sp.AAC.1